MHLLKHKIYSLLLLFAVVAGCNKKEDVYPDPYAGGKEPLGVVFSDELPSPQTGSPGDQVTFKVAGLLPHKDAAQFYMSGHKAEIVKITAESITVKVPEDVSSGSGVLNIGQQVFTTSLFRVKGNVKLDKTFKAGTGTDFAIAAIVPAADNRLLLLGNFGLYNSNGVGNPLNGIALIEKHGAFVSTFHTDSAVTRYGFLSAGVQLPDGKFILAGFFSQYGRMKEIRNLTRIHPIGLVDTTTVNIIPVASEGSDPHEGDNNAQEKNSFDTVPAFNGGVGGTTYKLFYTGNRILAVGQLGYYSQYFYRNSTKATRAEDLRRVNSVAAMDIDGNLDSSYHYDLGRHEGLSGANGGVLDGALLPGNKLVLVGTFTRFDGTTAGNIVCLDANGRIDPSFKAGSGADGLIYSANYNAVTGKIVISGTFKTYNGITCNGLMLLNADGSPVTTFQPRVFTNGVALYSIQLKNGLIVVTGNFDKYDNNTREGMVILNPDGTMAKGYNNTGKLQGIVTSMLETTSAEGEPAVLVAGNILSFDNTVVGNIFRMVIER